MQLQSTLVVAIIAICVVGRAFDVDNATPSSSQMGRQARDLIGKPEPPALRRLLKQAQRKIRFKRDGAVQGFFDDDHASDADWKKFTEKGGALVS